ncbi:MAG: carbohydrate-binding domain-containing protein [Oscillospiraceae bacterium]|nr:carbohydrate-binding domain-containing protein [Oscillospiraceae bacterium]
MAKRLICVIISVLMIVSLLPTGAFAADSGADEVPVGVAADTDSDEDDVEEADENPEEGEPAAADPTDEPAEEVVAAVETEETVEAEATNDEAATGVAKIGGTSYSTLAEAIAAVTGSDQTTITLTADTTATSAITISNTQNIILDLDGKTLTLSGTTSVTVTGSSSVSAGLVNNGTLTIKNGTVTISSATAVANTGSLTIESNATVSGVTAVSNIGGTLTTSGTLTGSTGNSLQTFGGTVNVTGGSISTTGGSGNYVIAIFNRNNDTDTDDDVAASVTISGGTISGNSPIGTNNNASGSSSLTITGGTISGAYDAIYWPSAGTITIGTSGQTDHSSPLLTCNYGSTIGICCGKLIVYGGTITSTISSTTWSGMNLSAPLSSETYANTARNSSGMLGLGDAISIYSNRSSSYAQYGLEVTIYDGVFTAASGYAVRYTDSNLASETDSDTSQSVSVTLNGGTYTGGIGASNVSIAAVDTYVKDEDKAIVYGGTYLTTTTSGTTSADTSVEAYLAEGVSLDSATGTVTSKAVAYIENYKGETTDYYSLSDALAAAGLTDTVYLYDDYTATEPISFSHSTTLDINGKTITYNGDECAIKNGLTVTIQNGTVVATNSSEAIRNMNGTLTLKNLTVTGGKYAVQNYASADGDSYKTATLTIDSGTYTVSVSTNADAYAAVLNAHGTLVINGGTFTGYTAGVSGYGVSTTINGGTFTATKPHNSGTGSYSYGINISDTTVSISAGTFTGYSMALYNNNGKTGAVATDGNYLAEGSIIISGNPFSWGNGTDPMTCVIGVAVAKVGAGDDAVSYGTLQSAINAASSGATVTLVSDTIEDVEIPSGKTIILDLNGKTLTNQSTHTITNYGTLTITDSTATVGEDGTLVCGTVDNVTHGKAAVWNDMDCTCTILAGKFTRSLEAGMTTSSNGGNSWYTILNHGTMTIGSDAEENTNDCISISNNGIFSSMIDNGWSDGSQNTNQNNSTMKIYGGTFTGGLYNVKNDDYGVLEIYGGTFSGLNNVLNWNDATISGGYFTAANISIYTAYGDATMDKGTTSITGGDFTSSGAILYAYSSVTYSVSGGTYNKEIASEYCADGFVPTVSADGTSYGVSKLTLGASSDTEGTTSVEATSISGYGEATMYVGVSADNISTYSNDSYPTTTLQYNGNDYIFAGWYEDSEGETACSEVPTNSAAYAKFVDAGVMTVMAQVTAGTTADSETTDMRFVTTVDTVKYSEVGFSITVGSITQNVTSTSVYEKVYGGEETYNPTDFSDASTYFVTYILENIPTNYFTTDIVVRACWKTQDGTTVYGSSYTFTVSQGC